MLETILYRTFWSLAVAVGETLGVCVEGHHHEADVAVEAVDGDARVECEGVRTPAKRDACVLSRQTKCESESCLYCFVFYSIA